MAYVSLRWDTASSGDAGTNLVKHQFCVVNKLLMSLRPSISISNMRCSWRQIDRDVVTTERFIEITDV